MKLKKYTVAANFTVMEDSGEHHVGFQVGINGVASITAQEIGGVIVTFDNNRRPLWVNTPGVGSPWTAEDQARKDKDDQLKRK